MQTTTFTVPDMSCSGCADSITTELTKVSGLAGSPTIDIADKLVTVSLGTATADDVIQAIKTAGYTAQIME